MRGPSMIHVVVVVAVLGWGLTFASWTPALAQSSTGTIRGFVRDAQGQPLAGASVAARQPETNVQRTTMTTATGFFNISGLQPGNYVLKTSMIGRAEQERPVRVLIGQTLSLDLVMSEQAVALAELQVVANRTVETRTPEVATNITQDQIENVPINDRNFLTLALLVPGVRSSGGAITAGGQSPNNVNVFIDGVSFKNDILQGGVAGQDASQGNPFPQAAVQEFRVITQQYKAEYQKATSAVISATTRTGTNEWRGEIFSIGQNKDLVRLDFISRRNCADSLSVRSAYECPDVARRDKWQGGVSLGGPIIRDRLFFFGTYEGNYVTFGQSVTPQNLPALTAVNPSLGAELGAKEAAFDRPIRSNLYFGKFTYVPRVGSPHLFELSTSLRDEYEIRDFGGLDARETATILNNDVNTMAAKYQLATSSVLNELSASFQRYRWNPTAEGDASFNDTYRVNGQRVLTVGARCCAQDWVQDRLSFRNDVTYTVPGVLGDHVFKLGANLDFLSYDSDQTNNIRPARIWNSANNYAFPEEVRAGFGVPGVSIGNKQLGVYIQDDWNASERLALNLGVRWDYETNDKNNDHVTRASDVTALQTYVATLPCAEPPTADTVRARQLICDLDRFTTDGSKRDPFLGAIQPRFGFSYDLFGGQRTVLFGGLGVYFDRRALYYFASEITRGRFEQYTFRFSTDGAPQGTNPTIVWNDAYLTREGLESILQNAAIAPGGELHLYANDLKPPRSNQFSVGVRQSVGDYQFTANYTGVRGYDLLVALRANRNLNGSCCQQNNPIWSNLFAVENRGQTWYDAFMFKGEKRYSPESRWGLQVAYTLAHAEQNADPHDRFTSLGLVDPDNMQRFPAGNDERHHLTSNFTIGLPWDVRFSGIVDLGSGTPYNASIAFGAGTNACTHGNMDCEGGNDWPEGQTRNWWRPEKHSFIIPNAWAYRNVDLRLEKRFPTFRGQRVGVIAEVFNVFDFVNFTGFDLRYGAYEVQNGQVVVTRTMVCPDRTKTTTTCETALVPALGRTNGVITDLRRLGAPRRFQLGLRYQF
jgi:carboxypeptidase family protein/TonB-dependent receptor-like protein